MPSARWVYAIVGRDTPLPDAGVTGLALVPCRELAAVTGRIVDDGAPATIEAVLRHEGVVEAVRRRGPALPVRFGTAFRDAAAVASALAERYALLAADLDRLGDKVELGVTALWAASPAADTAPPSPDASLAGPGAGARWLRARAAQVRREDAAREHARVVARAVDAALGPLALERKVTLLPTPRVAVRAAYLLDLAGVETFRNAFDAMRRAHGALRFLLTGPWSPYSFVRRTETESGGAAAPAGRLDALARLLTDEMQRRHG